MPHTQRLDLDVLIRRALVFTKRNTDTESEKHALTTRKENKVLPVRFWTAVSGVLRRGLHASATANKTQGRTYLWESVKWAGHQHTMGSPTNCLVLTIKAAATSKPVV